MKQSSMLGNGTISKPSDRTWQGHTDPIWNLDEIANLHYKWEPFNDVDTLTQWQELYQQNFTCGTKADYTVPQPRCQIAILDAITADWQSVTQPGFIWFKLRPGEILPEHVDTYANYCRYANTQPQQVVRIIVFLQDWRPGFLFEFDGVPVTGYSAGTWVAWHNDVPHMAGNFSKVPRYTLQITATI